MVLLAVLAIPLGSYLSAKPYPDCDGRWARAGLAGSYDNRRRLHAVAFDDLRALEESMWMRHCAVTVHWGDGSVSEVRYEFDLQHSRYSGSVIFMWIDVNGGIDARRG